jgi:hypothetical protein
MENIRYQIVVNGHWIGKQCWIDPRARYYGKMFAVKGYKTIENAVKRAFKERDTAPNALIEVYKCWGSFPNQREVIFTINDVCDKSENGEHEFYDDCCVFCGIIAPVIQYKSIL